MEAYGSYGNWRLESRRTGRQECPPYIESPTGNRQQEVYGSLLNPSEASKTVNKIGVGNQWIAKVCGAMRALAGIN